MIAAHFDRSYEGWRAYARRLLTAGIRPEEVLWSDAPALFEASLPNGSPRLLRVPQEFLELATLIACHRDEVKWDLLYRVLYRIVTEDRHLLKIESDPEINRLLLMKKQITHDMHRMTAFVRFREVDGRYVAWHRPDHLIVDRMAPWFVRRFGSMRWSILTPDRSAHWDTITLTMGPGVDASEAPQEDSLEDLWRSYYASIFNPARVNEKLMRSHVPARYWASMPETQIVPELIVEARSREKAMCDAAPGSAAAFIPSGATLPVLREAVHRCRGCELYAGATQPVFGEGPTNARLVLVGEQPGDREDVAGRAFVGPAGQLLDRALDEAGLRRQDLYITNAVKHFRYEERGKKRIHKTASRAQIAACQPWLESELQLVKPELIVCLGATAILSVVGKAAKVNDLRGQIWPHRHARGVTATVHPSYLLRVLDRQQEEYERFVADLRFARNRLNGN